MRIGSVDEVLFSTTVSNGQRLGFKGSDPKAGYEV
jgi:hypothetical protein